MIENSVFLEISIAIAIATIAAMVMKIVKQPTIIGYIFAGIIVGPSILNLVHPSENLAAFSQIGIALLLFIVGLNLNLKNLREVGAVALVAGVAQVCITFFIGYLISRILGFPQTSAVYIAAALTFSSTIIIVKLLSDKNDLDSLYGKISIGILLIQDIIAIFVLVFLGSLVNSTDFTELFVFTIFKVISIMLIILLLATYVLPKVLDFVAKSQELLFLFGISWVLVLSVILTYLGFSIEMGALFAGISLASSPFHFEIGSKLKPLRDFFIIIFFISLGTELAVSAGTNILLEIIILSALVLIGNPLIVMSVMGLMGYKKRIGLLTGFSMAQISEFSLILVFLGLKLNHINQEIVSIVTLIGIITIAGSTYMIKFNEQVYKRISKYLTFFERKNIKHKHHQIIKEKYEIILFGHNRIGYSLVKSFTKLKKDFLIVDYNPDIIHELRQKDIPHKYGDASDPELLEELNFSKVELVISTIPHIDTNLTLLRKIKRINKKTVVIMTSHQVEEAFELYEHGADYVILPHFLGGDHASAMIEKFGTKINKFVKQRIDHIEELTHRRTYGHDHPKHHRHH